MKTRFIINWLCCKNFTKRMKVLRLRYKNFRAAQDGSKSLIQLLDFEGKNCTIHFTTTVLLVDDTFYKAGPQQMLVKVQSFLG